MVIFLFITRTVWDRYLQVVIVKLDAINAATTSDESRMYYFTDMAQGQRAGLITPRSLDRNGLPVFIISAGLLEHATAVTTATLTGMAQR